MNGAGETHVEEEEDDSRLAAYLGFYSRSEARLLFRVFTAWVTFVHQRRATLKCQVLADTFYYRLLLRRNWSCWRRQSATSVRQRTLVRMKSAQLAQLRSRHRLVFRCFTHWRHFTRTEHRKRDLKFLADKFFRSHQLSSYFSQWRVARDQARLSLELRVREFVLRHAAARQRRLLAVVLSCMRRWTSVNISLRQREATFLVDRQQGLLRECFVCWKEKYEKATRQRDLALTRVANLLEQQLNSRLLTLCFHQWLVFIRRQKRQADLSELVSSSHRLFVLRTAFRVWKSRYEWHLAAREALALSFCAQLQRRQQLRLLKSHFDALNKYRLKTARSRHLAELADDFRHRSVVNRAFGVWKCRYQLAATEREQTLTALWHWSSGVQRKALLTWRGHARARREKRTSYNQAVLFRRALLQREAVRRVLVHSDRVSGGRLHSHPVFSPLVVRCAERWLRVVSRPRNVPEVKEEDIEQSILDILEAPRSARRRYELDYSAGKLLPERLLATIGQQAEKYDLDCRRSLPVPSRSFLGLVSHFPAHNRSHMAADTSQKFQEYLRRLDQAGPQLSYTRVMCHENSRVEHDRHANIPGKETDMFPPGNAQGLPADESPNTCSASQYKSKVPSDEAMNEEPLSEVSAVHLKDLSLEYRDAQPSQLPQLSSRRQPRLPEFLRMSIERMGVPLAHQHSAPLTEREQADQSPREVDRGHSDDKLSVQSEKAASEASHNHGADLNLDRCAGSVSSTPLSPILQPAHEPDDTSSHSPDALSSEGDIPAYLRFINQEQEFADFAQTLLRPSDFVKPTSEFRTSTPSLGAAGDEPAAHFPDQSSIEDSPGAAREDEGEQDLDSTLKDEGRESRDVATQLSALDASTQTEPEHQPGDAPIPDSHCTCGAPAQPDTFTSLNSSLALTGLSVSDSCDPAALRSLLLKYKKLKGRIQHRKKALMSRVDLLASSSTEVSAEDKAAVVELKKELRSLRSEQLQIKAQIKALLPSLAT